jgi:hypothetical protein
MAATFDTLKYAKQLEKAGVPEDQAEIHAEALRGVLDEQITVRFDRIDQRLVQADKALADVKSDLRLLKWMVTFNLALTVAVLWMLIRA